MRDDFNLFNNLLDTIYIIIIDQNLWKSLKNNYGSKLKYLEI